jgi:hypothetical protein
MVGNTFQVFQPTGVGQAIQIHQARNAIVIDDLVDQIRTDESRAAGN